MVSNLSNTKSDNSTMIFDTGSEKSFISTELGKKIKFANDSQRKSLLGKLESTLQKCVIVALKVFTRNSETLILELICTPVITIFGFLTSVRHAVKNMNLCEISK